MPFRALGSSALSLQSNTQQPKYFLLLFFSQAAKISLMATHPDAMAPFTYSPLLRPDSLRVLKVTPDLDKATGHICIELQETSRDTSYRCLSYMWGDQTERLAILVNGCKMSIGKSLFEFLEVARLKFANEPLWIDAVCINQEDNEEKSVQVQKMGRTYAGAQEVLIWLGRNPSIVEYFEWINRPRTILEQFLKYIHLDATPKTLRKPIIEFVSHPYWRRAWIIQEVVLARSRRLLCCGSEADSDSLFPIYHVPTWKPNSRYFHATLELDELLLLFQKYGSIRHHPWRVARQHAYAECKYPRDKLYSLLAIIDLESKFEVNYDEDIVELYWKAMRYFSAWCSPYTMDALWDLLSMDSSYIVANVQEKGQDLSTLVPVRRATATRRVRPRKSLFNARQILECDGYGCPVTHFSSCDILLCPKSSHFLGDVGSIHFSVRRLETGETNAFELHLHSCFWSRMQCPTDTELWYIDGVRRKKLETWDDVTSYAGGTVHTDEEWENKPHLSVKLSQQYILDYRDHAKAERTRSLPRK
jgi:hypothetical protein